MRKSKPDSEKPKAAPKKRGRPSPFDTLDLEKVKKLALKGWTDAEMAEFFGVDDRTWHRWKKAAPVFCQSLDEWKQAANARVERALYERAIGYEHIDTYLTSFQGEIITKDYIKRYPPDAKACQYWLNNRDRDRWKNYMPTPNEDAEGPFYDGAEVVP